MINGFVKRRAIFVHYGESRRADTVFHAQSLAKGDSEGCLPRTHRCIEGDKTPAVCHLQKLPGGNVQIGKGIYCQCLFHAAKIDIRHTLSKKMEKKHKKLQNTAFRNVAPQKSTHLHRFGDACFSMLQNYLVISMLSKKKRPAPLTFHL